MLLSGAALDEFPSEFQQGATTERLHDDGSSSRWWNGVPVAELHCLVCLHALTAADDCREAVANYLFQLRDPSEDEMQADPMMRQELDRQQALLAGLAGNPLETTLIDEVRRSVGEEWADELARRVLELTEAKYPSKVR